MKTVTAIPLHSIKLLDRIKEAIRYKHSSMQTEEKFIGYVFLFARAVTEAPPLHRLISRHASYSDTPQNIPYAKRQR